MKYYPRGSLDTWIYSSSNTAAHKSKIHVVQFIHDISRGILAMHTAGFVHCDLKPQNVLLDMDAQGGLFCCLTDFGITQIVDETTLLVHDFAISKVRGLSTQYAAPEAFERFRSAAKAESVPAEVVMKVDLYSLGVIMFELLGMRQPWHAKYRTI